MKYIQGFLGVAETSNNGPKLRKEPLRAQTWLAQNFTLRSVFPSSLGRKRLLLLLFWKEELWPFHRCDEKIPGERRTLCYRKHFLALKIAKKSQNTPAKKYKFFVQLIIRDTVTEAL